MSDELHMREAVALARKGLFRVEPNPLVGALVVLDGDVVGRGYHARFGGPHAEVVALGEAGSRARGATMFVTLEPCGHRGKTPPCAEAVVAAGVSRVVFAASDPNPLTAGRGPAILRLAGIEVESGLLEEEARALNARYEAHLAVCAPWVLAKWAMSLDGKIADAAGGSGPISGTESHRLVHEIRGAVDAVAVGVGTVLADDPDLRARWGNPTRTAVRLVFDSRLRTPLTSRLVRTAEETPVWIAGSRAAAPDRAREPTGAGCRILDSATGRGGVDLPALMGILYTEGIRRVLLEGGGRAHGSAFGAGIVQQVAAFCAPFLLGGAGAPTPIDGAGLCRLEDPVRLDSVRVTQTGPDVLVEGFVSASRSAAR